PQRRRAARVDRLPIGSNELRVATNRSFGKSDTGNPADSGHDRLRDWLADGTASSVVTGEGRLPADLEIDVLIDMAEQRGERVVEGVGEDKGPRDERDPEHDGEGGEREPQLVGKQALEGDLPHLSCPAASFAPVPSRLS